MRWRKCGDGLTTRLPEGAGEIFLDVKRGSAGYVDHVLWTVRPAHGSPVGGSAPTIRLAKVVALGAAESIVLDQLGSGGEE